METVLCPRSGFPPRGRNFFGVVGETLLRVQIFSGDLRILGLTL